MNCEEIRPLLAAWLDGELPQNTRDNVKAHIALCGECREAANAYRDMQQAFQGVEEVAHWESLVPAQDDANLWQNIQLQIQAEESAALRSELEQMRQLVCGLQREVSELRWQVNSSLQREINHFDALMPGTQLGSSPTNLHALL